MSPAPLASLLDNFFNTSQSISPLSLEDPALLQLPGLTPPPGITANFTNSRNRGPVLIIVNGILLGLMTVFIAIRFYTKLAIVRKVSWDDLTISFSVLGAITLYILFVWRKSFSLHAFDFILMHSSLQRSKGHRWEGINGMCTWAIFSETIL